jgi:hypothetical protein
MCDSVLKRSKYVYRMRCCCCISHVSTDVPFCAERTYRHRRSYFLSSTFLGIHILNRKNESQDYVY